MASIYDDLKVVAGDLLKDFKQGVIKYVKLTHGTITDVDEPPTPTEVEYSVNGTARGVKFKYVQNGFAVVTDLQVTLSTTGINDTTGSTEEIIPDMKDFIKVDGVRYKIVKILPKPPAGIVVANVVIIRK